MPTRTFRSIGARSLPCLLAVLLFLSCHRSADPDPAPQPPVTPPTLPDLTTQVSSSVSGFVTDGNNGPVSGATVRFGGSTVLTGSNGAFEFRNVMVPQTAAVVTVTKAGFFNAIKTYRVTPNGDPFFRVKLLAKNIIGTASGTTGGTVNTPGLSVSFPAAATVDAGTGAAYTGTITVRAAYLDPTDTDLPQTMPGDLRGLATDGSMALLRTFGMAAVELTGASGQALQLAAGKLATLTFTIPPAQLSTAPPTIPLWSFNETNGLWKQEGTATRIGSTYRGDVAHFSYWNCDTPSDYVRFGATIVNEAGVPVPFAYVRISLTGNAFGSTYGYTNAAGFTGGFVPPNSQLLLELFDNTACGTPIYTQAFTTTNVDLSLGTITLPASSRIITLTGSVKNCANATVAGGYVFLSDGSGIARHKLTNGAFTITKLVCSLPASVTLVGEDSATMQQSPSVAYTISSPGTQAVPPLVACGVTAQQFFTYTDNGTQVSYSMPVDTMSYLVTSTITDMVSCYRIPNIGSQYSSITYAYCGPNTTVGAVRSVSGFSSPFAPGFTNSISGTVTITEFGPVGQFVSANFSVQKTDPQTGIPHTITGSFRVRRSG
jgi:hypothetical protein